MDKTILDFPVSTKKRKEDKSELGHFQMQFCHPKIIPPHPLLTEPYWSLQYNQHDWLSQEAAG